MTPLMQLLDKGYTWFLPILTLMMLSVGGLMRYTRTNMLEVLNSELYTYSACQGFAEKVVINKHASATL